MVERVALGGVRAQGDPQLAHDGGRVGVVALDVAYHDAEPVLRQGDHVVPVATDLPPAPCSVVAHGDFATLDLLDLPGKHRRLQPRGEFALLVEEGRALQRLGHDGREPQTQIALVGVEGRALVVEERKPAQRARLCDQW